MNDKAGPTCPALFCCYPHTSSVPLPLSIFGSTLCVMFARIGNRAVFIGTTVVFLALTDSALAQTSPLSVGYFCNPDTKTIVDGQYYLPQSDPCVYLSANLSFGPRMGDIYRGVVGSSTLVTGHSIGAFGATSTQSGDVPSAHIQGVKQGEDMFVAIYRDFNGSQFNTFRNYFKTASVAPPHQDYGFIRFKWGIEPIPEPVPEEPDPVIIIPGILGSEQVDGVWVIDPILHTYDDLIATLDVNHYTPDIDLFTFPYNWRKSNVETAVLLKEKIDAVKDICDCDKVDLVAHSMGGLVARQYIQSDAYENDVDQLIFLGTPHLGAPKAYLMWEGGEVGPLFPISGTLMEKVLSLEAEEMGFQDLFTYLREQPISSVQELLPIYDYIFDDTNLRNYPDGYPINSFLENLKNSVSQLENSGVRVFNIVGSVGSLSTISGIQIQATREYLPLWEHGYPKDYYALLGGHGLIQASGDGTVPVASASFVEDNLLATEYEHSALPVKAQGDIYKILTENDAGTLSHEFDTAAKKILHILMHSPADLLVEAPDGKKIGKENGNTINQIPGAFYTGFNTNTEFITILNPIDGEYKVITQGTGNGEYTVETNYISEATTTTSSFTGNTLLGLETELVVSVDNTNPSDIEVLPTDIEPPVVSVAAPEIRNYLRSEILPINISAEDVESGVKLLSVAWDGATTSNPDTIDLFFHKLGEHTLTAEATDNVNNTFKYLKTLKVEANATSTRSDMFRALSLGWMTKRIYDDLAKKFDSCFKKKTVVTNVTKTITTTGRDGKPMTKQITEKVSRVEIYFDKKTAQDMLKALDKYRGKGLNEQGYQLLKEDVQWLIALSNI